MNQNLQLGYLVLEVSDPAAWVRFSRDQLGMTVEEEADGSQTLVRMDDLQQRFILRQGPADDVAVIGLLATNGEVLDSLVKRVQATGTEVREGTTEEAQRRRVKRLVCFTDPAGVAVELATGPYHSLTPFVSTLVPAGFHTGAQGLGHAVLMVDDLASGLAFWTGALGFRVSDTSGHETPSGVSNAAFMHCNKRHHSVALVQRTAQSTYPKRLLHFMVQAQSMDAVGMAFDRALDVGLNINRSLGRHPNDRMFSFYATTPSGFDFEFGWGAVEVGEDWAEDHYDHISAWGHRKLTASGS